MTRNDIERLLHCARTEGLGAGPNTLAEVCEWALERLDLALRSETDAELAAQRLGDENAALEAQHCAALARVGELEKLAYLGEHHFPDLTHKARLEELVPVLRATESRAEAAEAKLAKVRGALFVVRDAMASNDESPDATAEENWWDPRRPIATKVWQACAALSDEEPKP